MGARHKNKTGGSDRGGVAKQRTGERKSKGRGLLGPPHGELQARSEAAKTGHPPLLAHSGQSGPPRPRPYRVTPSGWKLAHHRRRRVLLASSSPPPPPPAQNMAHPPRAPPPATAASPTVRLRPTYEWAQADGSAGTAASAAAADAAASANRPIRRQEAGAHHAAMVVVRPDRNDAATAEPSQPQRSTRCLSVSLSLSLSLFPRRRSQRAQRQRQRR